MLPPLEVVARLRPFDLLAAGPVADHVTSATSTMFAVPRPAPYATVVADLRHVEHRTSRISIALGSGTCKIGGWYEPATGDVGIDVTDAAFLATTHRSRRHGRVAWRPDQLAVTLTGTHVSLFCHEDDRWVMRARVDVGDRIDTHDERWLAGPQGRPPRGQRDWCAASGPGASASSACVTSGWSPRLTARRAGTGRRTG